MQKALILSGTAVLLICAALTACKKQEIKPEEKGQTEMTIAKDIFGKLPEGQEVQLYTLANSHGIRARLITLGATLISLEVPDRDGVPADIVLGHDTLAGYLESSPYFGCIVGRYGNRIARGRFTLDGVEYKLATNNGENHLHGGLKGFDKMVWDAEAIEDENEVGVRFHYLSPDAEEGYPGNLDSTVTYTLTEDNELKIAYEVKTDKATPVNLTHHSYFNLAGQGEGDILGHELMLAADRFTPVDAGLIPTGELRPVADSPWDFLTPTSIGARIDAVEGGYDHNFVLDSGGGSLELAARVADPASGRVMEIFTTEPGIQFYSGNFLDGTITGKAGKVYHKHYGFCLETQHFPDSPNQPGFPSTILRPGETYTSLTVHRFSTRRP